LKLKLETTPNTINKTVELRILVDEDFE